MQLSEVYLALGESGFGQLIRGISIGKLKTYQLYDAFKGSAHLAKLNTESLHKHIPRFWARLAEHDEQFAKDLAQTVLVSHLDMIVAVLDFLGVTHEGGFFRSHSAILGAPGGARRAIRQRSGPDCVSITPGHDCGGP